MNTKWGINSDTIRNNQVDKPDEEAIYYQHEHVYGYSSRLSHMEYALKRMNSTQSETEISRRLNSLGYIVYSADRDACKSTAECLHVRDCELIDMVDAMFVNRATYFKTNDQQLNEEFDKMVSEMKKKVHDTYEIIPMWNIR